MSKNPAPAAPAIDTHFHVFSGDAPAAGRARYRPAYAAPLERWADVAAACGVRRGVVVQPSFFGADNGELLAALAAAGGALRGVVVLDPAFPAGGLADLHRAGVRGIRWNLVGVAQSELPRDSRWRGLLAAAHALGWHLELHADTGRTPEALSLLPDVPVAIVLDHFGKLPAPRPGWAETFDAVARETARREVFVKLSGPYRNPGVDLAAAARRWRDVLGAHRLLWGSDWPWTNHEAGRSYARLAAGACEWLGDPAASHELDRAAERLFGWPAAEPA